MNRPNNSILITTFNRCYELGECISAVLNCRGSERYNLVIVYHDEMQETVDFLKSLKLNTCITIPVNGCNRTGLANMNINRIFGLEYCFSMLQSEYVVAIEDDVVLGYDALEFCESIMRKYSSHDRFRAVNLGSREFSQDPSDLSTYGLYRYGLSGQGSAITKREWDKIKGFNVLRRYESIGFDSLIEAYMKTGFVIMPKLSRYLDLGWNGTHAPKDSNNKYYLDLKKSFVGKIPFKVNSYVDEKFKNSWRGDCIQYDPKRNFLISTLFFLRLYKNKIFQLIKNN